MTIGELSEAQRLTENLADYIQTERDILEGLKASLEQYQQFLLEQMRENRDLRTTTNKQSDTYIRKIFVRHEA